MYPQATVMTGQACDFTRAPQPSRPPRAEWPNNRHAVQTFLQPREREKVCVYASSFQPKQNLHTAVLLTSKACHCQNKLNISSIITNTFNKSYICFSVVMSRQTKTNHLARSPRKQNTTLVLTFWNKYCTVHTQTYTCHVLRYHMVEA